MESFMKKILSLLIVALFCLCSCVNRLEISADELSDSENLAERYFENMMYSIKLSSSRTGENSDVDEEIFYDEMIFDEAGNNIQYADLSTVDKKSLQLYWKQEYINQLKEKIENDEEFARLIKIENETFEETVNEASRAIIPLSFEQFAKKLFSKYEKKIDSGRSASGSSKDLPSLSNEYNRQSLEYLSNYYKKGRMVICKDTSSSSASSFIGHSSMMKDVELPKDIFSYPAYKSMITSYPKDKNITWVGKTDGVQFEPTVYWVNTQQGANSVSIVEAQKKQTIIGNDGKKRTEYVVASEKDAEDAVNYAEEQLGKPYDWQLWWKYDTTEFYCSSLLWRSWYETDKGYSFNSAPWITPGGILSSDKTKTIKEYKNR